MRTELTYAADQMVRYNGDLDVAHANVADYYSQGGLSSEYFNRVVAFMYDIRRINAGLARFIAPQRRRRIIKAIRRKMPRVHTEKSNWRLTYNVALEDAAVYRADRLYVRATACIREARHIRQIYL